MVGAYAVNNSIFDVGVMAAFGFVGYIMRRTEIPMAPLVITLLLSHEMESSLIRSLIIFRGDLLRFVDRPIAFGLLAFTAVLIALTLFGIGRRRGRFAERRVGRAGVKIARSGPIMLQATLLDRIPGLP